MKYHVVYEEKAMYLLASPDCRNQACRTLFKIVSYLLETVYASEASEARTRPCSVKLLGNNSTEVEENANWL